MVDTRDHLPDPRGRSQEEDEPLLTQTPARPFSIQTEDQYEGLSLSAAESERLLSCLHDIHDILSNSVDDELHYMESGRLHNRLRPDATIWVKLRRFFWKVVGKFTGGRVMAATMILQLVCLVMLSLVDCLPQNEDEQKSALQIGSALMMVLQIANLIIIIFVSVQLLKQIKRHKVSRMLLIQSYIATILLFSGIYTATYRLDKKSWKFVQSPGEEANPVSIVTVVYIKFVFFSVSTATLCGAADSLPNEWYTSLFASCQMLLSFMYFTSVLGTAITQNTGRRATELREQLRSLQGHWNREPPDGFIRR